MEKKKENPVLSHTCLDKSSLFWVVLLGGGEVI